MVHFQSVSQLLLVSIWSTCDTGWSRILSNIWSPLICTWAALCQHLIRTCCWLIPLCQHHFHTWLTLISELPSTHMWHLVHIDPHLLLVANFHISIKSTSDPNLIFDWAAPCHHLIHTGRCWLSYYQHPIHILVPKIWSTPVAVDFHTTSILSTS